MQKNKLLEYVQKYLDETPQEQIKKDFEEVSKLDFKGDTADEYFKKVYTLFSDYNVVCGVDLCTNENDKSTITVSNQFGELDHYGESFDEVIKKFSNYFKISEKDVLIWNTKPFQTDVDLATAFALKHLYYEQKKNIKDLNQ